MDSQNLTEESLLRSISEDRDSEVLAESKRRHKARMTTMLVLGAMALSIVCLLAALA